MFSVQISSVNSFKIAPHVIFFCNPALTDSYGINMKKHLIWKGARSKQDANKGGIRRVKF